MKDETCSAGNMTLKQAAELQKVHNKKKITQVIDKKSPCVCDSATDDWGKHHKESCPRHVTYEEYMSGHKKDEEPVPNGGYRKGFGISPAHVDLKNALKEAGKHLSQEVIDSAFEIAEYLSDKTSLQLYQRWLELTDIGMSYALTTEQHKEFGFLVIWRESLEQDY